MLMELMELRSLLALHGVHHELDQYLLIWSRVILTVQQSCVTSALVVMSQMLRTHLRGWHHIIKKKNK